jgi:hypothetical protein
LENIMKAIDLEKKKKVEDSTGFMQHVGDIYRGLFLS